MSQERVEIEFDDVITETPSAWLIDVEGDEHVWLPKSCCEMDEDRHTVVVPEWLAVEKGLV